MLNCQWENCNESYPDAELLKKHLDTHFNTNLQCFWSECPRYGEVQANKYALVSHVRKHSGDRPFKCTKCEKAYTRADALNKHVKTHKNMEKSLEDLVCKINYLRKEIEKTEDRVEMCTYQLGIEMRRLAVVSSECIDVIRCQLKNNKDNFTCSGGFFDAFLDEK